MPFSNFHLSYHAQITQNENFFKASTPDIYVALNEESGQAKYSEVSVEEMTDWERMQLCFTSVSILMQTAHIAEV